MQDISKSGTRVNSELLAKTVIRLMKRDINDRFAKTGSLTEDDQEFCDAIDWHPVDELELREEYVEKLKRLKKESTSSMTVEEFNAFCNSL